MVNVKFSFVDVKNQQLKAVVYVVPNSIPTTNSPTIVAGNGTYFVAGGATPSPIVSLFPQKYNVRVVNSFYETIFNIDITNAASGSTVNASDYIV